MVYDRKTTYNRLSVAGVQILMTAQRELGMKNSETSRCTPLSERLKHTG